MTTETDPHTARRPTSFKNILDTAATLAVLVAAGAIIWTNLFRSQPVAAKRSLPVPSDPILLSGSPVKGLDTAKVALIAFSDFECPYCKSFARDTLPLLEKEYVDTGQVAVVFRHLPLPGHRLGLAAAKAADCAAEQGQFWRAHDALFAEEGKIDSMRIGTLVSSLKLDAPKFASCAARPTSATIERDGEIARRLGIASTPAFLIGSILPNREVKVRATILGAEPLDEFRKAIRTTIGRN